MQIQEQNATFSLPPSSPTQAERTPAALKGIVFLAGVLLVALLYESWLQKSDFMRAAREQLAHNDRVRAEVPKDRLVEWRPGDGWEPICNALGLAVPAAPFPHVNTTDEFRLMTGLDAAPA